jgi:hypothetical protein
MNMVAGYNSEYPSESSMSLVPLPSPRVLWSEILHCVVTPPVEWIHKKTLSRISLVLMQPIA